MRGKPTILTRPDRSRKRTNAKRDAETAFDAGALPRNPPAELAGMRSARAAWRNVIKAHEKLPGELFNGLDRDFIIGYCLAVEGRERSIELERLTFERFKADDCELKDLLSVRSELRMSIRLIGDMQKQLYMTPRSRGGVTPPAREASPEEVIAAEIETLENLIWQEHG